MSSSSSAATANPGGPTTQDPRECNTPDERNKLHPIAQLSSVPISTPQIIANIRQPIKVEKLTTLVGRSSSGDSLQQHRQIKTTSNSPLLNLTGEKVVMATQPVQVVMQQQQQQQQGGHNQPHVIQHQQQTRVSLAPTTKIITKFIVKNTSAANSAVSVGSSSGVHHVSGSNLNFKTIPLQKNNISVSPVKGGFKIPISPVKQQMKFSVVPSSNNIVKRVEKLQPTPVGANFQQKTGGAANFQFQTIPQGNVVNKIAPNNNNSGGVVPNQTFTIQTMNQTFQSSSVRAPCTVRLIPANGPVSSQPTLIPVQTAATQQGHPKIVHHQQPFVSFQQVRPLTQIKPQPRLIMPAAAAAQAAAAPQQTPKIANLSGGTLVKTSTNNNITGYTLVPAKYVEQLKKQNYQPQYIQGQEAKVVTTTTPTPPESMSRPAPTNSAPSSVINGKVHKPCNCTKSMCLKLYCECFANGHFCDGCNCINCHNNLDYDSDRSKAIRSCLDRNPYAFRPKIGRGRDDARAHQKGCNCRRSGCLKNYCECYEARIPCTSRCKCIGCKNLEGNWPASRGCRGPRIGIHHQQNHHQPLMSLADAAAARCQQQQAASSRITSQIEDMHRASTAARHSKAGASGLSNGEKQPSTFFTKEVIEASSVCMLAQAEEAEKSNHPPQISERLILEEFGRLLMQIIDAARKTKVSVSSSAPNTQQPPPT